VIKGHLFEGSPSLRDAVPPPGLSAKSIRARAAAVCFAPAGIRIAPGNELSPGR
jgi:hypothetical protein